MVPALADLLKVNKKWCSFAGGTILGNENLAQLDLEDPVYTSRGVSRFRFSGFSSQ